MKKQLLTIVLLLSLSIATGCNSANNAIASTIPKLITPADTPMNTISVGYNDISISEYHNAIVTPYVEEYVFPISGTLSKIHVILGTTVEKGEILAELNHSGLDSQISTLYNEIATIQSTIEKDINECAIILESLKNQKSDILSGKIKSFNPSIEAEILDYDITLYETKIRQNETRLAIELQGPTEELARLEKELENYYIYAPFSGSIVYVTEQTELAKGTTAIAVADLSKKYVQISDYISESYISHTVKIYATHNGTTYDLTYVPLDSDESNPNLKSAKGSITNFVTNDNYMDSFEYGNRLLVTMDTEFIENVLAVPNTTLFTDENGATYVYIVDADGVRTKKDIVTGETDTIYTVIVDGLREGDVVYVPN